MIFVALNWIYIVVTTFFCGFAFSKYVKKAFGYQMKNLIEILFFGLIIATVYAQIFSLFGGVGIAANLFLSAVCILICAVWRKEIAAFLSEKSEKLRRRSVLYKITVVMLMLIWCYCTSRGYMHYDSDLYHAQSIRWIEEYGIVKGLGNIHVRFAYNSSIFALSALYSMREIAGQSLHTVNGLIALLLSIEVMEGFKKRFALSDFARLGAFYYLTLIYRDIVAPASDYCVMCVVFFIIIRWLSCLESGEKKIAPYGLLCVMGVYSVTLKLTTGLLLLLLIKPAYALLKGRRYREIIRYFLLGLVVLVPWVIRTALISGYLLYPFPALDVLDVDWKIDAAAAALDAAEIKTWGRGLNNAALAGLSVKDWFPGWFQTMLPGTGKLLILADMACIVILAGFAVYLIINAARKENVCEMANRLLVLAAAAVSYLFWQLSAPLLRYGYAYVLLLITLTAGLVYQKIKRNGGFLYGAVLLLLMVKIISLAGYMADTADKPYYIVQQDYGVYDLDSFVAEGITFYYPKNGDRVGYVNFPAVPKKEKIVFRGTSVRNGFKPSGK